MRTEKEVLSQFTDWAKGDKNIRTAVLTSSRCDPETETDFLSDYDIEMYVDDISLVKNNDDWLSALGKIMVRWPYKPRPTFDKDWITRLIIFHDEVRIDFQITNKKDINPIHYDYGYKILIDKDNILSDLPKPTYSCYNVKKPSQEEFETLVNEFWWNATYVPKYLWRDELPFAKSMLGQSLHDEYLKKIIEWHIGLEYNWEVNTGLLGRHFKKYLSPDIWAQYEATFADSDIDNNWVSFFTTIELFVKLAKHISKALRYNYPATLEADMVRFYKKIKDNMGK